MQDKLDQVRKLLAEMTSEVDYRLDTISPAEDAAFGNELRAVQAGIDLTYAASMEIRRALKKYKRASAPMVEQDKPASRMFK